MGPWPAYHQGIFPQPSPSHRSKRLQAAENVSRCFYGPLRNGSSKTSSEEFLGAPIPGGLLLALPRLIFEKISVALIIDQGGTTLIPGVSVSGPEIYRTGAWRQGLE